MFPVQANRDGRLHHQPVKLRNSTKDGIRLGSGSAGKLIIVSSQLRDVINLAGTLAIAKGLGLIARIEKPLTPEKLATLDAVISED